MARSKECDPDAAVATAIEVFWARRYGGTSMQDLVDELGLNRGSIYTTFGSKHDLFVQALTEYCQRAPQALLDALETDGPLLPRLRGALIGLIDADLADPNRRGRLLINSAMETMPADEDTAVIFERTARTLRVGFEAAVRRARFDGEVPRSLNPADAASFLLTTLQGLRVTAKATGDRQVLTASVDLVLRALGKEIRLWRRRPFACPHI